MSGLRINVAKSTLFASGSNLSPLLDAAVALRIGVGTLPICYLGMPLTAKSLTSHDYEPLIDKIRGRMLCWSNRALSFAGRIAYKKSQGKGELGGSLLPKGRGLIRDPKASGFSQGIYYEAHTANFHTIIFSLGATGTTYLGVQRHARVCDAVNLEGWTIRGQRCRRFQELYRNILAITPSKPENGADIVLWKHADEDYLPTFSASKTWDQVRVKGIKLSGAEWFGYLKEFQVWEVLACRLVGNEINPDWQWTITRLQRMRDKELDTILARLLFQSMVYHVWRERNVRRHQQPAMSTDQMRRRIDKVMRNRIVSLR
ncbi:PREDICTED: uncharacterized protein LOC106314853 [Brassica oleracea var. oleracea]|uniref:uncharacterized protein LOC106314853 n=1 Tax=Brassica oleracea var. oleracea TaxID=109376 RepID=UPI0006A732F4|nr:PREDICTED: uncharacterized protein LOC106314853 [Brassica oleracea var. oleracea]